MEINVKHVISPYHHISTHYNKSAKIFSSLIYLNKLINVTYKGRHCFKLLQMIKLLLFWYLKYAIRHLSSIKFIKHYFLIRFVIIKFALLPIFDSRHFQNGKEKNLLSLFSIKTVLEKVVWVLIALWLCSWYHNT